MSAAEALTHNFQIHAVPPFTNVTQLNAVLDKMQDAGLYLMYDMRWYVYT